MKFKRSSLWAQRTLCLHKMGEVNGRSVPLYVDWHWWLKASMFFFLLQIIFITQSSHLFMSLCSQKDSQIYSDVLHSLFLMRCFGFILSTHTCNIISDLIDMHSLTTSNLSPCLVRLSYESYSPIVIELPWGCSHRWLCNCHSLSH